jgi:DNA segregation ATPase FtsK/SpoIIIE-like protein
MAQQAARSKNKATPSIKTGLLSRVPAALDGLVVVALFLGLGYFFGFTPAARSYVVESLGFGLIPVSLWLIAVVVCLRYRPRTVLVHWRVWVGAAALAAISVGVLSLFHAREGTLFYASLGGQWGKVAGGQPLALAVVKLAVISILLPPLLYPRRIGAAYLTFFRNLGLALQYAANHVHTGASHLATFSWRSLQFVGAGCASVWSVASQRFSRVSGDKGDTPPDDIRSDDTPWDVTEVEEQSAEVDSGRAVAEFWAQAEQEDIAPTQPAVQPLPPIVAEMSGEANSGAARAVKAAQSQWSLPSIDILSPPVVHEQAQGPLEQMARHVEASLAEHGVVVEVKDIKSGPRIVQFGLVPGWVGRRSEAGQDAAAKSRPENRVKVQSILSREKDLALALKTPYLRIEAPVPGEALVGLQVPTPSPSKVHLREVIEGDAFTKIVDKRGLPVALGQDTGGVSVAMDLASLPHLLIAGSTGSGKSVCINSIVASLLLTKPPDQLRMLMVDPKRVELTPFNNVPHLIAPVIVDVDEVNPALRAVLREMYRRYKQMEEIGTRNISGYNGKAADQMPYLVVIVDELADLMIAGGFEVEQSLVRLAQLGRAAGIHLVLATQRPSVQVVTGLLKANIPARVAFAVASQVDSRVILDVVGAEKLLGKGDGLLLNSDSPKPRRVQGTLVYDEEIDEMVTFWREQKGPPLPEIPMEEAEDDEGDDEDLDERMLEQARDVALRNPHVSSSYMSRKFKVGEQRAAQIMEALEEEGLVIPR